MVVINILMLLLMRNVKSMYVLTSLALGAGYNQF